MPQREQEPEGPALDDSRQKPSVFIRCTAVYALTATDKHDIAGSVNIAGPATAVHWPTDNQDKPMVERRNVGYAAPNSDWEAEQGIATD